MVTYPPDPLPLLREGGVQVREGIRGVRLTNILRFCTSNLGALYLNYNSEEGGALYRQNILGCNKNVRRKTAASKGTARKGGTIFL